MPNVERAGKYSGYLKSWRVERTKASNVPQFVAQCECHAVWDGVARKEVPISPPQHITAFLPLIKKDKTANLSQIDALKDALGWDGKSFTSLNNGDYAAKPMNFTVDESDYNGKTTLKVGWINAPFAPKETSADDLAAMDAEFGAVLAGADDLVVEETIPF